MKKVVFRKWPEQTRQNKSSKKPSPKFVSKFVPKFVSKFRLKNSYQNLSQNSSQNASQNQNRAGNPLTPLPSLLLPMQAIFTKFYTRCFTRLSLSSQLNELNGTFVSQIRLKIRWRVPLANFFGDLGKFLWLISLAGLATFFDEFLWRIYSANFFGVFFGAPILLTNFAFSVHFLVNIFVNKSSEKETSQS